VHFLVTFEVQNEVQGFLFYVTSQEGVQKSGKEPTVNAILNQFHYPWPRDSFVALSREISQKSEGTAKMYRRNQSLFLAAKVSKIYRKSMQKRQQTLNCYSLHAVCI
jgi:hypothetical protein